jgi:hypothetical protein
VVEVAPRAALEAGRHGLEDATAQANTVTPGAEREPVEVDAGSRRDRHERSLTGFVSTTNAFDGTIRRSCSASGGSEGGERPGRRCHAGLSFYLT